MGEKFHAGLEKPQGVLTLTIFFTMMAYIFLVIIIYMFCSLMSVFMYFSGFESFASLER